MVKGINLERGQILRVDIEKVGDRLPEKLFSMLLENPYGRWMGGYKMVDANSFGLILEFRDGTKSWFFEEELSYDDKENANNINENK